MKFTPLFAELFYACGEFPLYPTKSITLQECFITVYVLVGIIPYPLHIWHFIVALVPYESVVCFCEMKSLLGFDVIISSASSFCCLLLLLLDLKVI